MYLESASIVFHASSGISEVTGCQFSRPGVNLMIRITGASRAMGTYRLPSLFTHDRRIMTRCVGPSYFDTVQCVPIEVSAVLDLLAARRVPERLIEIAASSAIRALFEAASLTSEMARSQIITSSSDPSSPTSSCSASSIGRQLRLVRSCQLRPVDGIEPSLQATATAASAGPNRPSRMQERAWSSRSRPLQLWTEASGAS